MSVIEEEYTPFKNKKKGIIIINQDGKFSENLDLLTKNETINIDKSQSINFQKLFKDKNQIQNNSKILKNEINQRELLFKNLQKFKNIRKSDKVDKSNPKMNFDSNTQNKQIDK